MRSLPQRGRWATIAVVASLVATACSGSATPAPAATATPGVAVTPTQQVPATTPGAATPSAAPSTATPSVAACDVTGKKIAFVHFLAGFDAIELMVDGVKNESKAEGFAFQDLGVQGDDHQAVITLGQQAVAQGLDGIVVLAATPDYYPLIKAAHDKGIKTVVAHVNIAAGDAPGLDANIHPDPVEYGGNAAKAIGEAIGGKGSVAVTQQSFNTLENDAAKGFTDTMKKLYPGVTVLAPQAQGADQAAAVAVAVGILQAHPDVVGAFSSTSTGGQVWYQASQQTGKTLQIIGMDYVRQNLDMIRDGKVLGNVAQPLYEEHAAAVKAIHSMLCGGTEPYDATLPAPIITKAELDQYYKLLKDNGL